MMKKVKYLLTLAFTFILAMPVFAEDMHCAVLGTGVMFDKKIPNTVHNIILVIQIAVPVLLVIFGMIDLVKAVTSGKEDDIKKAQGTFIKRLIAGALVFFIIVIVELLVSFAGDSDNKNSIMGCAKCFINGASSKGCK